MQITCGSLLSILHLLIIYYSRWANFFSTFTNAAHQNQVGNQAMQCKDYFSSCERKHWYKYTHFSLNSSEKMEILYTRLHITMIYPETHSIHADILQLGFQIH